MKNDQVVEKEVEIIDDGFRLKGDFAVPIDAQGIVLFAHGSGSSRRSPRNMEVARMLNRTGLATLLFDLLTHAESLDRDNVFNISLLAKRLKMATAWACQQAELRDLPIGYFGASTGAAAALMAAGERGSKIHAIVSRGGRPDLALSSLEFVECQTLLIVGSKDYAVLELNQIALPHLKKGELIVIPGATHLFEEPGTLEKVSEEAAQWFTRFLRGKLSHKVA